MSAFMNRCYDVPDLHPVKALAVYEGLAQYKLLILHMTRGSLPTSVFVIFDNHDYDTHAALPALLFV